VGFGISTPEQARQVAGMADGVVVGSAIVNRIAELGRSPEAVESVSRFVQSLADVVHQA
jgi:tryptophan synthase alpha chain